MENLQNKQVSETEISIPIRLIDERKDYRIDNDIMTRRLKNRERQRRYRARKRLQEEIKKASTIKQPIQTGTSFQLDSYNSSTRVHCSRNWKKDARNANVSRNSFNMAARTSTCESLMQCIPFNLESHSEPPTERLISETAKKVFCQRNWKADARKKKS